MTTEITPRDPARFDPQEFFQLVPIGNFPLTRTEKGASKSYVQQVDQKAVGAIVAAFNRKCAADANYKLLIDFEHFSHDTSKSTEAACWVEELQARPDGVWARGTWSDAGLTAVRNGRYRYLSPVWFPNQTEQLGGNRFRPLEISDAGLTNRPNLGSALQPFWNRADGVLPAPAIEPTLPAVYVPPLVREIDCRIEAAAGAGAFTNRWVKVIERSADPSDAEAIEQVFAENPQLYDAYRQGIFNGSAKAFRNRLQAAEADDEAIFLCVDRFARGEDSAAMLNRLRDALRIDPALDSADAAQAIFSSNPALYSRYRRALYV